LGAIVNSSRHLIFAHQRAPYQQQFGDARWKEAVAAATAEMNQQLRSVVGSAS
jgi:orotidine-5'-phosphate decarboxylase